MEKKPYSPVLLFIGVMSVIGFPENLKAILEEKYGSIAIITDPFDFSFTDYYVPEMGNGIKRFFLCFENLVSPDMLSDVKTFTNNLELMFAENINGEIKRKINLDPGIISEANLILATTKNRANRIAIGDGLFAEITLIYQNHKWQSFQWTYPDYCSDVVQNEMLSFRSKYLELRRKYCKKS